MKLKLFHLLMLFIPVLSLLSSCSSGPSEKDLQGLFDPFDLTYIVFSESEILNKQQCTLNNDSAYADAWEVEYRLCDANKSCIEDTFSVVMVEKLDADGKPEKDWSFIPYNYLVTEVTGKKFVETCEGIDK